MMSEPRKRIAYVPFEDNNNAYVSRMHDVLSSYGRIEKLMSPRVLLRKLLSAEFRRYDATFLNWVENDGIDPKDGRIAYARVARMLVKTLFARMVSRRLVFVRHNTYPHLLRKGQEDLATRWIDHYERLFDVVYSHSGAELNGRRLYVPHPLYKLSTEDSACDPAIDHALPPSYFVMFGRVVPYKKIAEMARGFPANRNLLVIGLVTNEAYDRELRSIDRPNVYYRPGYLTDAAAQRLIRASNGIVLAHSGESTVVSGSFFYAMSLPVPVVALETPFLRWVQPQVGSDLLQIAPDFDGLVRLIRDFIPHRLPADLHPRLTQAFGDEVISEALKTVFDARQVSATFRTS